MNSLPILLVTALGLSACDSQTRFQQCVDERQKQFKTKNPDAPYSLLVNRRETFERECVHLK
jgi:hypothetical protein